MAAIISPSVVLDLDDLLFVPVGATHQAIAWGEYARINQVGAR